MERLRHGSWIAAAALLLAGCPGGSPADDDATDAADGGDETGGDAPTVTPPADPAPPVLTPCPAGWREVADPETGTTTCDPWPETGREDCAAVDEAHFPGEPGCARIGSPCPAGDWADDLPTDVPVLFVRAGEPPGGTGTRDAPLGTIGEAITAGTGEVIALGKGEFVEAVPLTALRTLWGACVTETRITAPSAADTEGTVTVWGRDATIRNLRIGGPRPGVWAVGASRSVHLEDVVIDRARIGGIVAASGARVTGRGVVIRGTEPSAAAETYGFAINVEREAQVEIERLVIDGSRTAGAFVTGNDSLLTLSAALVRGTGARPCDGRLGLGVSVLDGGEAELRAAAIEENREAGGSAGGRGAILRLSDVVIRDTGPSTADGLHGFSLQAYDGGRLEAVRVTAERGRDSGIVADGAGTSLRAEDVVVRDTGACAADGTGGQGMSVQGAATAEIARAVFERNRQVGLIASGAGSAITLADVAIRDTGPMEADETFGRGLQAQDGATIDGGRVAIERNRDVGLLAGGADAAIRLADVAIRETRERACTATWCADLPGGHGVGVYAGALVELTAFAIVDNALCGIQLARAFDRETGTWYPDSGAADLHDGEVSGNVVGANVQDADYDLNRLMDRVLYRDNGRNIDTTEMPVPDPGVEI